MLQELGREIMTLLEEKEVKDTQIAELRRENEGLRANAEPLNAQIFELQGQIASLEEEKNVALQTIQDKENTISTKDNTIANLQSELEIKIKEVEDKKRLLDEQNKEVARLQEQSSLKLDEVKAIIEELKGLIVNA